MSRADQSPPARIVPSDDNSQQTLGEWGDMPEREETSGRAMSDGSGVAARTTVLDIDEWADRLTRDDVAETPTRLDFDPPEWLVKFARAHDSQLVKDVANRIRPLPDWLEGYEAPVVRSATASGSRVHVPDLESDSPLPECRQNRNNSEFVVREASVMGVGTHYQLCGSCSASEVYREVVLE